VHPEVHRFCTASFVIFHTPVVSMFICYTQNYFCKTNHIKIPYYIDQQIIFPCVSFTISKKMLKMRAAVFNETCITCCNTASSHRTRYILQKTCKVQFELHINFCRHERKINSPKTFQFVLQILNLMQSC